MMIGSGGAPVALGVLATRLLPNGAPKVWPRPGRRVGLFGLQTLGRGWIQSSANVGIATFSSRVDQDVTAPADGCKIPAMGYTCNWRCGYSSRTAQGIRAHSRFCPNRQQQAEPTDIRTGINLGSLHRPLPRLMPAPVPPAGDDRGKLANTIVILKWINAREVERNAAERQAREAAAQVQEELRQRAAREARLKTGAALLDKSLESTPGLGLWDRYVIRAAGVAALARSSSSEPIDAVVDEILRVQLRLHSPAAPAPNDATAAAVQARSVPVPTLPDDAEDEVDDDGPDDEENDEICDDPNCKECAPAAAGGSGWGGLLLALGGLAFLALLKQAADAHPAAPSDTPTTA